jgi:hypothetical protein
MTGYYTNSGQVVQLLSAGYETGGFSLCSLIPTNTPTPTVTQTPTNTPTNTVTPTNTPTVTPSSTGGDKWLVSDCCLASPDIILILPPGTIAGQRVVYNNNCWTTVSTSVGSPVGAGVTFVGTNSCVACIAVYSCGA